VQAAKGLRDFSRANPLLVIKGGVLEGKTMSPDEISKLADLEPRDVLLSKLAGAMKATMAGAAATFTALPVQMARLLAALQEKNAAEAPAGAGNSGPAQDAVPAQDAGPAQDAAPAQDAGQASDAMPAGEAASTEADAQAGDEPAPEADSDQ